MREISSSCEHICTTKHADVEEVLISWLKGARSKSIPISWRILQEKAYAFARNLWFKGFHVSDDWLCKWKKKKKTHGIEHKKLSGEAASVSDETIEEQKNKNSQIF